MSLCRRNSYRLPCLGFSLVELLVAMTVLSLLSVLLVTIAGQSGRIWQAGERDNQSRQRARAALNFISRELKQAALPLDRSNMDSLRFAINPKEAPSSFASPDSLFWQAPIATDASAGRMASVGYFVHWNSQKKAALYRLFLNPSDYDPKDPNSALSDLPPNWEKKYCFLENVLGIWVKAYEADETAYTGDTASSRRLPALVEISLVLLDSTTANRLDTVLDYDNYETATAFINDLPEKLRPGASIVSMKVNLDNSIGWQGL